MKIETKRIADLHPIEKNIRRHPAKQIKEYIRSIEMFGQIRPLVIDEENTILIGNGMYLAMQEMGLETCACYVRTGMSHSEKLKLMAADNRVYELGITDTAIFEQIVAELDDTDVPGWDEDLISMLMSSTQDVDNMVSEYGSYSEENVADLSGHSRIMASPEAETREMAERPTQAAPEPARDEENAEIQRYITCPHCGGKICL